jgi:hypothetical protein
MFFKLSEITEGGIEKVLQFKMLLKSIYIKNLLLMGSRESAPTNNRELAQTSATAKHS